LGAGSILVYSSEEAEIC